MKRATVYVVTVLYITCYFNPRPREEGDQHRQYYNIRYSVISIHALVKRATIKSPFGALYTDFISIHALVKRATLHIWVAKFGGGISIHALVKRATLASI